LIGDILEGVRRTWLVIFALSHFVGKVLIVGIFIFSSSTVINLFLATVGYPDFISFVKPFGIIYGDKLPWAATSMLLASTVAIGHMRNLEINEEKLSVEVKERLEKEYKAKRDAESKANINLV